MLEQNTFKECQIHKNQCIGIDFSPECLWEHRYCCFDCVKIRNGKIQTYSNAKDYYLDIKKEFKQKKEDQNTKNLKIFTYLGSIIKEIQDQQNQQLNKLYENIIQLIKKIEANQTDLKEKLNSQTIDSYLQSENDFVQKEPYYQQIFEALQMMLQNTVSQDLINEFNNTISKVDDSVISFSPESRKNKSENKQKYSPLNFLCPEHNEEIKNFDLREAGDREKRMQCFQCISGETVCVKSIADLQQQWKKIEIKQEKQLQDCQNKLQTKISSVQIELIKLKEQFSAKVEELNQILSDNLLNQSNKNQQRIKTMGRNWFTLSKNEQAKYQEESENEIYEDYETRERANYLIILKNLKELKNLEKESFSFVESVIKEQIKATKEKEIQTIMLEKSNIECQTSILLTLNNQIQVQGYFRKRQCKLNNLKGTQFQLLPIYYSLERTFPLKDQCFAIAINQQQTFLAVGCAKYMIVYCFSEDKQQSINEGQYISVLHFLGSSSELASGDAFGKIKIWKQNPDQKWCVIKTMDTRQKRVNDMIINTVANIIFSCRLTIKLWKKELEWASDQQQFNFHSEQEIFSISLNNQETQLISYGADEYIVVSEISQRGVWFLFQKISVVQEYQSVCSISDNQIDIQFNNKNQRACFINDNVFAIQIHNESNMKIYMQDEKNKSKYIEQQEVKIAIGKNNNSYGFKLLFNKAKQILLNQNGQTLNVIKRRIDSRLIVEQTINFQSDDVIGAISFDGKLLCTCNGNTLQVRQLQ